MSKYIDAEPLMNALKVVKKRGEAVISLDELIGVMGNYPTIDPVKLLEEYCEPRNLMVVAKEDFKRIAEVQEVKHGRWIKNDGRYGWHCSVCGEDDLYAFAWNSDTGEHELQDHYCPNCGSRMDLEGEEE